MSLEYPLEPSLAIALAATQLPLLGQAFFLHPDYRFSKNARLIRLALIPLEIALLGFVGSQWHARAPPAPSINNPVGIFLFISASRSLIWGTTTGLYYQLESKTSSHTAASLLDRLRFAFEFLVTFRGVGWSFGAPLKPLTKSVSAFLGESMRYLTFNLFAAICAVICIVILDTYSIFDRPILRHLNTFFFGTLLGASIASNGCMARISAVITRSDLREYPYHLDSPMKSTSLAEFWSRRWHSNFRFIFVEAGSRPAESVALRCFGPGVISRAARILGAFTISGLMHEFGLWFGTYPDYTFRTTIFFIAQGVGVVIESNFARLTGRRVGGWAGRIWGLVWLVGWGRLVIGAMIDHKILDKDGFKEQISRTFHQISL